MTSRPVTVGSSPPSSPTSSTTSASSPSTIPRTSAARSTRALRAMVEAIQAFGGTREKFIGDAVFAVFGWPHGHDDDALRAAHCALAIREALATRGRPDRRAARGPDRDRDRRGRRRRCAARTRVDWSLTGPAVTTAARIQAIAQPGEILLDEATLRAARKALEVEDRGPQLLRGQTQPIRVARLLGEAGFQPWRPPAGRIVGREARASATSRRCSTTLAPGDGAAIVVEGEAGIGKSRLMADLADAAPSRPGSRRTWVDNVSYGAREPYRFGRALAQAIADEHGTDSGAMTRRLLFTVRRPARAGAALGRRRRRDRPRCRVLRLGGGGAARAGRPGRGRRRRSSTSRRATRPGSSRSPARGSCSSTTSTGSTRRAPGCSTRSSARPTQRRCCIVIGTRPGPTPADATLARRRADPPGGPRRGGDAAARGRRRGLRARAVRRAPPPRADRRQPAVHHRDRAGDLRRRHGAAANGAVPGRRSPSGRRRHGPRRACR